MSWMFHGCLSLTELKISNLITKNVIDMSGMFSDCISLKQIDLSNFNTCNVTDINEIFADCQSLIDLNILNFSLNFCYNLENMFLHLNKKCKVIQNDQKIEELLEVN